MKNLEAMMRSYRAIHPIRHHEVSSGIKPIFVILVDISGYTRFITMQKISLLHAEKIVGELMETILEEVEIPVTAHEILGDAISLYAIDEGIPGQADKIYEQLQKYFNAFRRREAALISACSICVCDACKQVGKLRLKAILHHGEAAFTKVNNVQKISGEDIILSHRLLKNSLNLKEYILMTADFFRKCQTLDTSDLTRHKEHDKDLGSIDILVKNIDVDVKPADMTFLQKVGGFIGMELYALSHFIVNQKQFSEIFLMKKIDLFISEQDNY